MNGLPTQAELATRAAQLLAACGATTNHGDQLARTPITGGSLGAAGGAGNVDAAVERAAERIDDAAQKSRSHRHADHLSDAANKITRGDLPGLVEEYASHRVTIQREGKAELAALEADQLVQPHAVEARHVR